MVWVDSFKSLIPFLFFFASVEGDRLPKVNPWVCPSAVMALCGQGCSAAPIKGVL